VLNQPGDADTDPLKTDARMVRRLFVKAIEKAPDAMPYFVFIDINAPLDAAVDERWKTDVQRWMHRLPTPTADEPDVFNAAYITNFSPHYDGDDISRGGSWLGVMPQYVGQPLEHDILSVLMKALDTYGSVPPIDVDGALLG
jgi:hypothetical protein